VLPSFPPESFGLVLIEAMACGKAVLAHDIPGVRSVVREGESGLLARPGDASDLVAKMHQLLRMPSQAEAMGRRGRAQVEANYVWSAIVPGLVGVYEAAMAGGPKKRVTARRKMPENLETEP
jgi:glycosyltransferase involved in cell wall biosynthesis